ncbi:response regulator [Litorimonas sp. RW-G-Af-16]|uniref:response regulator n=1 Tax=Litorimonas sp. RW-G-Af-16 TaxID=3241168 RepID=UPI00390C6146
MTQQATYLDRSDTHILVIDDDDRIRDLLQRYLGKNGYRVSGAESAAMASAKMAGLSYDLLILDVMMPGEDGLSFARRLREHHDVPIIMLTALGESEHRIEGLKAGVDDYLPKPFEPEELLLRIDAIFRRAGRKMPSESVRFGPYEYDTMQGLLRKNGKRVQLTTGEQTLLSLLARQAGATVSRYILSENIKANSERAVDVQMTRLRRKLEDNPSEPEFLLTIRGEGYRLVSEAL